MCRTAASLLRELDVLEGPDDTRAISSTGRRNSQRHQLLTRVVGVVDPLPLAQRRRLRGVAARHIADAAQVGRLDLVRLACGVGADGNLHQLGGGRIQLDGADLLCEKRMTQSVAT